MPAVRTIRCRRRVCGTGARPESGRPPEICMPRAPGTANCVIFAALSCAWTYGDIDEGTDVGTAAAADSQLYAAPAYGQPPAADLFAGRCRDRGAVSGDRRPGVGRSQHLGRVSHPRVLQRLLRRIRNPRGSEVRGAGLRRDAPLRLRQPAPGGRHVGGCRSGDELLVRGYSADHADAREYLSGGLCLPARHLPRHSLHVLLQPAGLRDPCAGRQPDAVLVPALFDRAQYRARPLLHSGARVGRRGSRHSDGLLAGGVGRTLLPLYDAAFRGAPGRCFGTEVQRQAGPQAAFDRRADGVAVLDHGRRKHHAPERQQCAGHGLRGGVHGGRADQDVLHVSVRKPRDRHGDLRRTELRRRETRAGLAGREGQLADDDDLLGVHLLRADDVRAAAGPAVRRWLRDRDSGGYGAVSARFRFVFPCAGTALHPALHHSGRRLHESGDAFGRVGDDRADSRQPLRRAGLRVYRRLLRRLDGLGFRRSVSHPGIRLRLSPPAQDESAASRVGSHPALRSFPDRIPFPARVPGPPSVRWLHVAGRMQDAAGMRRCAPVRVRPAGNTYARRRGAAEPLTGRGAP